jgi:hypothetical protein
MNRYSIIYSRYFSFNYRDVIITETLFAENEDDARQQIYKTGDINSILSCVEI